MLFFCLTSPLQQSSSSWDRFGCGHCWLWLLRISAASPLISRWRFFLSYRQMPKYIWGWIKRRLPLTAVREAIISKKCSFFNIVQKAFDPPPFIWTFVLFCRGCFWQLWTSNKSLHPFYPLGCFLGLIRCDSVRKPVLYADIDGIKNNGLVLSVKPFFDFVETFAFKYFWWRGRICSVGVSLLIM